MNQELRQRLIGAVVVTALAAIFIPMLFDDPVDDSAQTVSELVIPEEPAAVTEEPAKKLPESAADVSPPAESPDAVAEDIKPDEGAEPEVLSTDELEAEGSGEEEQALERPFDVKNADPASSKSVPSLDTGIVEEEPLAAAEEEMVVKKPLQKPIQKPVQKIAPKTDAITPPKTVNKTLKPAPAQKAVEVMSVEKLASPVKPNPEPSRWYIQAGSFSKKENALSLADSLRKQGMPVLLETIQVSGKGTFYRLKVGPELDKKRAASMKAKLDQQKIKTILIAE
ncbi:MAG: hypothetical protein EPN89_11490 [Methylovulum sp.]|nr:MAG: hypothetical protein EPN89_11490 [Methylovulum sp.]